MEKDYNKGGGGLTFGLGGKAKFLLIPRFPRFPRNQAGRHPLSRIPPISNFQFSAV